MLKLLQHEENGGHDEQTSAERRLDNASNTNLGVFAIFVLDYCHRQIHDNMVASSKSFSNVDEDIAHVTQCIQSSLVVLQRNAPSKEIKNSPDTLFAKTECEHFLKRILELAITFSNETWNGKYVDFSVWLFDQVKVLQTHFTTHGFIKKMIFCDASLDLMKIASLMRATTLDKTGLISKEKLVSFKTGCDLN